MHGRIFCAVLISEDMQKIYKYAIAALVALVLGGRAVSYLHLGTDKAMGISAAILESQQQSASDQTTCCLTDLISHVETTLLANRTEYFAGVHPPHTAETFSDLATENEALSQVNETFCLSPLRQS